MKISASLLTWNRGDCLEACFVALAEEASRLRILGHSVELLILDNGSAEWATETAIERIRVRWPKTHYCRNIKNMGAAYARNQAFDLAVHWGSNYHLLLDGDVRVVPWSLVAELEYLESNREYCAIGPHWDCFTNRIEEADPTCRAVTGDFDQICATTQYGLFSSAVFVRGFRFDPRFGPGYGFEDEDFGIQLYRAGLRSRMFRGIRYMHYGYHSSLRNLQNAGADLTKMWEDRKAYILRKWEPVANGDSPLKNLLRILRDEPLPGV